MDWVFIRCGYISQGILFNLLTGLLLKTIFSMQFEAAFLNIIYLFIQTIIYVFPNLCIPN